ncbi:MAG: hypothetical protein NZ742_10110 [Acidobacteria bacterium]|nr:hypothetical protein [Acidobacteriota bacterium]MDW7984719.1 hypothetical protein [Acidobacteriota bacterium]
MAKHERNLEEMAFYESVYDRLLRIFEVDTFRNLHPFIQVARGEGHFIEVL